MKAAPGVVDFDTSLVVGKPEVRIDIDRKKAAELGVSVADIAERAAPDRRRLRGRQLQRRTASSTTSSSAPSRTRRSDIEG
jgi:multidrug efflux pump subunit AcrB